MWNKIFKRFTADGTLAQDQNLQVTNSFILPVISVGNEEDQDENAIGVYGGKVVIKQGGNFNPVGGEKTPIPTEGNLTLQWQTDLVPGSVKTYAQTFGNHIFDVVGVFDAGGGIMSPYKPNWSYTKTGANINTVTLTEVFPGELTFI